MEDKLCAWILENHYKLISCQLRLGADKKTHIDYQQKWKGRIFQKPHVMWHMPFGLLIVMPHLTSLTDFPHAWYPTDQWEI